MEFRRVLFRSHQARQHYGERAGTGEGPGFRSRQSGAQMGGICVPSRGPDGYGNFIDDARRDRRHVGLYVAGAGARGGIRRAHRPFQLRRRAIRNGHRPESFCGQDPGVGLCRHSYGRSPAIAGRAGRGDRQSAEEESRRAMGQRGPDESRPRGIEAEAGSRGHPSAAIVAGAKKNARPLDRGSISDGCDGGNRALVRPHAAGASCRRSRSYGDPRHHAAIGGGAGLQEPGRKGRCGVALGGPLRDVRERAGSREKLRTIPGENVARAKIDLSLPDADGYGRDTLERIRKTLGGDYVVLGSYYYSGKDAGGQVRLDLRLQDSRAGETVATVSQTGTDVQLLDLVSRTGTQVRERLGVEGVTPVEATAMRAELPSSPEAYRL